MECAKNSKVTHVSLGDALRCDNLELNLTTPMVCAICHATVAVSTLFFLAPVRSDLCLRRGEGLVLVLRRCCVVLLVWCAFMFVHTMTFSAGAYAWFLCRDIL